MTDDKLADEIELVIDAAPNAALGCMVATPTLRQIIAALRRSEPEAVMLKPGDRVELRSVNGMARAYVTELSGAHRIIQEQGEELRKAQARLAEVEKDAARYRFVRKNAYVSGNGWMFAGAYKTIDQYAFNLKSKAAIDDCDAAIDRAIAALKKPR